MDPDPTIPTRKDMGDDDDDDDVDATVAVVSASSLCATKVHHFFGLLLFSFEDFVDALNALESRRS